ncbi:SIR2 family protein [Arthrobacter sp. NPDC056691]|uniref:SIR2 family protein n=1 Tax=Arthrobacter sp. NPDC056691 TaxID=3345913 RepID=UPI00366D06A1
MSTNDFVALLGAGASRGAGIPLASELTRCALEALDQQPGLVSNDYHIANALNFVVAAIQLHDSRNGLPVSQLVGIERLVSAVELLKDRRSLEVAPFVREWDPSVETFDTRRQTSSRSNRYRDVERGILQLIEPDSTRFRVPRFGTRSGVLERPFESLLADVLHRGSQDVFRSLYHWLRMRVVEDVRVKSEADVDYLLPLLRAARGGAGVIGTLNYDLTVETCARRNNISLNRFVDAWEETGALSEAPDCIPFLKLHGSVDWVSTDPDSLRVKGEGEDSDIQGTPALVYGQREKLRSDGPFLQLIERWRSELAKTQHLIVAGYSFGDEHVNALIRRWLKTKHDGVLIVVDPGYPNLIEAQRRVNNPRLELWRDYGKDAKRWNSETNVSENLPQRMFVRREGLEDALRSWESSGLDALASDMNLQELKQQTGTISSRVP